MKDCTDQPDKQVKLINKYKSKVAEYQPIEFENGDSSKLLLARSRYILANKEEQWTINQKGRDLVKIGKNFKSSKWGRGRVRLLTLCEARSAAKRLVISFKGIPPTFAGF